MKWYALMTIALLACGQPTESKTEGGNPAETAVTATPTEAPIPATQTKEAVAPEAAAERVVARPEARPANEPAPTRVKQPAPAPAPTPAVEEDTADGEEDSQPEEAPSATDAVPPAQTPTEVNDQAPAAPEPPAAMSHALWDELLRTYVSADGHVNYKGLKTAEAKLNKYLAQLAANVPGPSASRQEAMAYWINAYNAFTVKLILDHWPVKSIRDIHGGNPWDVKWIELGGKKYSLNQIEHEILRKRYKDARIHFAVNCAARSCPPLYNRAFTPENLENVLDQRARAFINNGQYNRISPHKAELSKIFEWYREDFGDLVAYINRYSKVKLKPGARITFLEYDWSLNV